MTDHELKGALFFSDREPHITGYLVIAGKIEYEIAGWKASEIRADITARKRGEKNPEQADIFGGERDAHSGLGDG
jgi:hypothetical protein